MNWKINRRLLPIKLHYFLFNAALSAGVPFLPVYAKQIGISALAVGSVYTALSFIVLVTKPLFGAIADRFQNLKHLLMFFVGLTALSMLCMNFIPKAAKKRYDEHSMKLNVICIQNISTFTISEEFICYNPDFTATNCSIHCDYCGPHMTKPHQNAVNYFQHKYSTMHNITRTEIQSKCSSEYRCSRNSSSKSDKDCYIKNEETLTLQFWLFTLFIIIAWVSFSVAVTLNDTACYAILENRMELYGQQRVWGTIGWGTFVALAGFLNDVFTKLSGFYNYSPGFYLLAVVFIADFVIATRLQVPADKMPKHIFKNVCNLILKPKVLVFLSDAFIVGAFTGLWRSYLMWYLRSLNASQIVLGITAGAYCVIGELPFFIFSGWIIKKIGVIHSMSVSFLAWSIRYISYSYLSNPWWCVAIEILQGPSFALFIASMTYYAKIIAPPGSETTMQGLLGGTFDGIGVATGCLLGGFGFEMYGGKNTFFWAGIVALAGLIFHMIAHKITSQDPKNLKIMNENDEDDSKIPRDTICY